MKLLKKVFGFLLRVSISVILLYFLFKGVDKQELLLIIKNTDKTLLLLALLMYSLSYILCLWRWQMLLKAANIHLPLKRIIISYSGGIFFSLFLPSTIGGDFVRSIDLATHTKKPKEILSTVILDRLSGYVGLVFVCLFALGMGGNLVQDKLVLLSVAIIVGILVLVLVMLFNKSIYTYINRLLYSPTAGKIRDYITGVHQEMHIYRKRKKIILYNVLISICVQLVSPFVFYIIAQSLDIHLNVIYFLIFIPIIGAITLLPISIGGLGLRDATTIFFFAKAGIPKSLAFAMSLINFSFIVVYAAIGGLIYVLTVSHRRLQSS